MARLYEDFHVGDTYRSALGRTVTETDNLLFTMLTMNTNELHFNEEAAARTEFGRILVNSTFTCGLTHFPWPVFLGFSALAAIAWALYGALLGYFGGRTFHDKPWLAVLVAFGIAFGITASVEGWRRFRGRA